MTSPAGGEFTVELATNRAATSYSYNGQYASDWPDGQTYPEDYVSGFSPMVSFPHCISYTECAYMHYLTEQYATVPWIFLLIKYFPVTHSVHTQNQSMAAGTAFAISYQARLPTKKFTASFFANFFSV